MRPCRQKRPENVRPKQTEAKVPSEEMRKRAREWLYNADHPNECASQGEVDDLATLLDEVRWEGFAGGLEEAARIVAAHCCVSTCCDAQPGEGEAEALAKCVRRRLLSSDPRRTEKLELVVTAARDVRDFEAVARAACANPRTLSNEDADRLSKRSWAVHDALRDAFRKLDGGTVSE